MIVEGEIVSPGEVKGKAVFVDSSLDRKLTKKEVAVVSWLPVDKTYLLFDVGGIVLVGGGLLSHVATLAREFGIPCVRIDKDLPRKVDGNTIEIKEGVVYVSEG